MPELSKSQKELMRIRRGIIANQVPARKRKKLGKVPKWLYPIVIEREYVKILQTYTAGQEVVIQRILEPGLTKIYAEYEITNNNNKFKLLDSVDVRIDSYVEDFEKMMQALHISVSNFRERSRIKTSVLDIGQKVNKWNDAQWQKTMMAVLGITYPTNQESIINEVEQFSYQNVDLIKSLGDQRLEKIRVAAFNAFKNGTRHEVVRDQIIKDYGATQSRAKLIARDQVAKLNGSMMRTRQMDAGILMYIWRTSNDERVRKSHQVMDGKFCTWSNSTTYWNFTKDKSVPRPVNAVQLHPGQDYQCRCWAEAVFHKDLTGEETTLTKLPFHVPVGAITNATISSVKSAAVGAAGKAAKTVIATGLAYGAYGIVQRLQRGELVIPKPKFPNIKRKSKPKRYTPKTGETIAPGEVIKQPIIKLPQVKFPKIPEIKLPSRKGPTKIKPGTKPEDLPDIIRLPGPKPGYVPVKETKKATRIVPPNVIKEKRKALRELKFGLDIPNLDKMTPKDLVNLMHKNGVNLDQAFYDHAENMDYKFLKLLTERTVLYNKKFKLNLKSIEVFGGSKGMDSSHFSLSGWLNRNKKGATESFDMFMGGGFFKNPFRVIESQYGHLMYCGMHALVDHDRLLKGILDHELIHGFIDKDLGLKKRLTALYESKTHTELKSGLCEYATKRYDEMAAEGWKEYLNSSSPRPMAKQIGRMIMSSMNKYRFTHL